MASNNDRKSGAAKALEKYLEKDWIEQQKLSGTIEKRKHGKPEKEVEKQCLEWMRAQNWEVEIYESKATQVNGVWRQQSMKAGHADCAGIMPDGTSVAVEFKAPGKLTTFNRGGNERQKDFIIKRIHMNGFSCVVDSVERLKDIYERWEKIREVNPTAAQQYLLSMLP